MEIHIEHHQIVSAREQFGCVSPHVKLSVELVNDQVDVDILLHVRIGAVDFAQLLDGS